jgi:hypothetical protein
MVTMNNKCISLVTNRSDRVPVPKICYFTVERAENVSTDFTIIKEPKTQINLKLKLRKALPTINTQKLAKTSLSILI